VVGKITKLSLTSITVHASSGNVTDTLTNSTVVMTQTKGTRSDLKAGTFVRLTVGSKNTVTAISLSGGFRAFPGRTGARPRRTPTANRPAGAFGAFRGGSVVSLKNKSLSVRTFAGKTTTYTLASNVAITKSVRGSISNLRVGETVRLATAPGSKTVFAVTIEKS
jgi:hypothetical protein